MTPETKIAPLQNPLQGIDIQRWFSREAELAEALNALLAKRALVCVSPNRHERCDQPAVDIFWQDGAEWYPCCEQHWPSLPQWTGNTRFHGGRIGMRCFAERITGENLQPDDVIERYNRAEAC